MPGAFEDAFEKFDTAWEGGGVARILEITSSAPGICAKAEFTGVGRLVCARPGRFEQAKIASARWMQTVTGNTGRFFISFLSRRVSACQPRSQRLEARELFFDQLTHIRLKLFLFLTIRLSLFSGRFTSPISNKNP